MASDYITNMHAQGFRRVQDEADQLHFSPFGSATWRSGGVRLEIASYSLGIYKDRVAFYPDHLPVLSICAIITDAGARGQGQASRAMAGFIDAARAAGFQLLFLEPCPLTKYAPVLDRTALIRWYERFGFTIAEESGKIMSLPLVVAKEEAA